MTTLSNIHITDEAELKELLIQNLPARIRAGNEKHLSNIYEYKTHTALLKCKFINFNTHSRISIMVFDIDKVGDQTALDYYKNIEGLLSFIVEKIALEPTYILETQKGFHFGYHLKNHIFTHQAKALEYLKNIKKALTELLGCDSNASHRLNGVWRNPLLHPHYYSGVINYELSDFREFLPLRENVKKVCKASIKIDDSLLVVGNRNEALFRYAMKFAKGQGKLGEAEIINFLAGVNSKCSIPLERDELELIASSVYIYWKKGSIKFGQLTQREPIINEGIMKFEKMANLSFEKYEAETKRRQTLSAKRTNEIRDQEKASAQLTEARRNSALKRQIENQKKIREAVRFLEDNGIKVSVSSISQKAQINRRTVAKYYEH
jgi:hypothetical protein